MTRCDEERLDSLEARLREGIRRGKQGSYKRRMPTETALPLLRDGIRQLVLFTRGRPECERAWRLRSLAEECVLDYAQAQDSLQRAIEIAGAPTRKDLKRLAHLRQSRQYWEALMLSPAQLESLGEFLSDPSRFNPCSNDVRWTRKWLEENVPEQVDLILVRLMACGGYSDLQVLQNVVLG